MKTSKEHKPQQSRVIANFPKSIQLVRNNIKRITPDIQMFGSPFPGGWTPCIYSEIIVPPNVIPQKGTGTSGPAPWAGRLLDNGYNSRRNATRLHVINSNFGGLGGNNDNNLHPGSQQLNKNHLTQAENYFKNYLANPNFDNYPLQYQCHFVWNSPKSNGFINDPTIKVRISYFDQQINGTPINIELFRSQDISGPGLIATDFIDAWNDDTSTSDD